MSIKRHDPKRDANEPPIVEALQAVGANVYRVSGEGLPDLLVIFRGEIYLMEVKTGKGRLTLAQEKFMLDNGDVPNVSVVKTIDDALTLIGAI
jgi:Holliday junction resolvase